MQPTIDYCDPQAVLKLLDCATQACRADRFRVHSAIRLPGSGRLLVTGDLHDNPMHLDAVLRAAALDQSSDHHVIVHEVIHGENYVNGRDLSHRMLLKVADIKCKYPDHFHPLLGNHELCQMTGRGVSKGAGDSVALFHDGLEFVFGNDGPTVGNAIDDFLAAWPLALITESGVLCAHSLPSARAMRNFDPHILDRELTPADYESRTGSAYLMVWGRGHTDEHLARLALLWGVKAFCLGHESAENGYLPVGRLALVLNTDHERGVVLPLDLAAEPNRDQWLWNIQPIAQWITEPGCA